MSEKEFEAQLTLKDRLNFPYLLANQILTFQKSILKEEFSQREIRESIQGFVHLIPNSWKDKKWEEDLKDAQLTTTKDMRPIVAGTIRMSKETCEELGIEPYKTEETFDYYKMFQACVDLLDRRGMTSKKNPVQELENIDFDAVAKTKIGESDLSSE